MAGIPGNRSLARSSCHPPSANAERLLGESLIGGQAGIEPKQHFRWFRKTDARTPAELPGRKALCRRVPHRKVARP